MYVVVIDASHLQNNNNMSPDGSFSEAAYMNILSKMLKQEIESTGKIRAVIVNNPADGEKIIKELSKKTSAYILISEHTNHLPENVWQDSSSGPEVYYSMLDHGGKQIAGQLSKAVSEATGLPNNKAKDVMTRPGIADRRRYHTLRKAIDSGIAKSFLIKQGFHDNMKDVSLLKRESTLRNIAVGQAGVICKALKVKYSGYSDSKMTYYIRKRWSGVENKTQDEQHCAVHSLTHAIEVAMTNRYYNVYDSDGVLLYDRYEANPNIDDEEPAPNSVIDPSKDYFSDFISKCTSCGIAGIVDMEKGDTVTYGALAEILSKIGQ